MEVSISNVIVNYFLLHTDVNVLTYQKLQELIELLEDKFNIIIVDNDKHGISNIQQLCSDFLSIDEQLNLIQENILNYLEQLQPIYEWYSFREWQYSEQYYLTIKEFE